MSRGLFITGTGTDVGKTYVAALIARALVVAGKRVGVYKPVASGCVIRDEGLVSPDATALWEAAGRPGSLQDVCPQMFAAPLAPHLAARAAGGRVDAMRLRAGLEHWRDRCDVVLVEGAGGLMSPISDEDYNADLANEFGYPLVVVAANVLGTINATMQTLLTAATIHGGLRVAGVVLNWPTQAADDPSMASNRDELARRCKVPLLAEVTFGGELDQNVDWWKLTDG
ncbi:MAG TPA: dethiobiotin synthase [Lacipirellulaceae bacterium]|jgi:dethiobiotin synthetase